MHSRSSEGSQPSSAKDVNKYTTAGMSKQLNSDAILKTDTPRTCDLKTLRAKRLVYFVDRNHNCTNSSTAVGSLGFDDKQVNIDHTIADPQRGNLLNAEQNVSLIDKEFDINELTQHTRIQDTREVHFTDLETSLNISESDEKAACTPKPDYNLLENPNVSEIQKLRHILCWAQKVLKKSKKDSNTQEYQSTIKVNETELAESHLNPDVPQPTTFNWSTSTNKSIHRDPLRSRFDDAKCSTDTSSENCSSLDLLRQRGTLVPTSSFTTTLNDVQEQCTSTNIGYAGKHHFDSNNILERKYTEQVHTYNVSNNNWKFKGSGESEVLVTKLPNENCHSMAGNVSVLNSDNYFWIPLEAASDDESITENKQMKEASVEPFVKSNITPLLCRSNNHYHNNNREPTLSARTVTLRKSPVTYYSSGDILASPVNLHNTVQHNISNNNHNNSNNREPTLSARTVTLRKSPVTYCNSSGDILANPVNLHNAAPHYKSTVCDKGKHNYAWEAKKAEEYFSGGYHELSLGDSKIADEPGVSPNLEDAGFNLKLPIDLPVIPTTCNYVIESSSEEITTSEKDKGTKLDKASQERGNSDQFPEKFRNLSITNANKILLSFSSISPKYCSDIIMDDSENLPALEILKKEANSDNSENEARYQITESKAQNASKLSSLPMLSSYDVNDSKTSSMQLEKEESIESERDQITGENRDSFLYASNLVKCCPECKSDNSSTVNWCTECGCVLIGITPQSCDVTSNIDGRAFSNPRGSPNKEKIAIDGLKEHSEIVESEVYDFKDSEDSTCLSLETCEPQLSVYQKYLLYMEHLEKLRGQHQTREQQQTDVLLVKENANQTETVDKGNSSYGKHEPENSNIASFVMNTHFPDQTDRKHIVHEQGSEDNPIPKPDVGTIPLAENVPGVTTLHCGFQEEYYLQQDSSVGTSKNMLHRATLNQNFGNQNFTSLDYENNKGTLEGNY
ncbi:uncharacterized protein LOC127572675 [Pristis pectinata]|uniref:uncharacterized protein LOC127572675 n=1 Tax=Pristis pectinata TaxID=685728 RepID=UPI00223DDCBE|nr:uncharacterized protein LOC127572675 [Pristis pectinata]